MTCEMMAGLLSALTASRWLISVRSVPFTWGWVEWGLGGSGVVLIGG